MLTIFLGNRPYQPVTRNTQDNLINYEWVMFLALVKSWIH